MLNVEQSEPATDSRSEADGLDSFIHSFSIRVEYYRSFQYCLKRQGPMYPRRSSRQPKPSQKSPNEDVIQRKLRAKRQRTGPKRTEPGDDVVNTSEGSHRDIIDIINDTHDEKCVAEEDEGEFVEIADKGLDESDEDCVSVSSVASGPSVLCLASPEKWRASQDLCSDCRKLYLKARKMKAPIKNKLLDNDPESLTCDQWFLIKKRRPGKLPNARGKLMIHVQLVKKRTELKKGAKQSEEHVVVGESSACSRPHSFLRRNLRCCFRVPVKKERKKSKRRKRKGDDLQGSRVAKQQRLHRTGYDQHRNGCTDDSGLHSASGYGSSPGSESCSHQKINTQAEASKLTPFTTDAQETTMLREALPRQTVPKKTSGFRDLLAQLRGSSSMIVRETR